MVSIVEDIDNTTDIKGKITNALKSNSMLAHSKLENPLSLEIVVNYQRRFSGEDTPIPSTSVAAPLINYEIIIYDGDIEKKRIKNTNVTVNKGFGANLKTTFTLGLGKTAKDEEVDLQRLANGIVSEIKKNTR